MATSSTSRSPASVRIAAGPDDAVAAGQRLGEAADAVATHLGAAAVGVVERHPGRVPVGGLADQQAVGTDPGAGRTPHGRTGRVVVEDVERDEEVVGQAVVLGERDRGPVGSLVVMRWSSASITAGVASATGSCSMSIQRMRGSRRNHRSWRTANWRVRAHDRVDRLVEADSVLEMVDQLLVAERLAGRRRQAARLGEQARPRRRGRPRSSPDTLASIRSASAAAASAARAARHRSAGTG